MNAALMAAALLAFAAAAIHGVVGDALLRRIDRSVLPPSFIGGPQSTFAMIRISWHIVTLTFLMSGGALLWIAAASDAALVRGVGIFVAALYVTFAVLAIGYSIARLPSALIRHPAPLVFILIAALTGWGASHG
jgi:hypothetical protein